MNVKYKTGEGPLIYTGAVAALLLPPALALSGAWQGAGLYLLLAFVVHRRRALQARNWSLPWLVAPSAILFVGNLYAYSLGGAVATLIQLATVLFGVIVLVSALVHVRRDYSTGMF